MESILLMMLACLMAGTAKAASYDYWATLSPGGSSMSAAGRAEKVLVVIGNNGAAGSLGGPTYDLLLTARTAAGEGICTASLIAQPPMARGQQLIPLAFVLLVPETSGKPGRDAPTPSPVLYRLEVRISTQSPNDDANLVNNFQAKPFTLPAGGKPSCEKLLNH